MNGNGKHTYASGEVYEGEFKDGKRNGNGKHTYADGAVYEGEFKDDERSGNGKYTHPSGVVYEGKFEDGKLNGKGKYTYASGAVYEGKFKDDQRNGNGKFTYRSGGVYEGEFEDGKRNGKGKYTFASGDVYEGEFKDGKKNGNGKHTSLLDMVQEPYFLGDTDNVHLMLERYLDVTVKQGPSHCQACHQICAKDAIMDKCSVCKVARYCIQTHQIYAWKRGRLSHKVMCPLLTRWRKAKVKEGKDNVESCNAICNDFLNALM